MATEKQRTRIVDGFMELLGTKRFEEISLGEVAAKAEVTPPVLRGAFDSRMAILAEFTRRIDARTLEGIDPALAGEAPRERLFDVLMRRFDLLSPHKAAVRSLRASVRRDPLFAAALNGLAMRSMRWMMVGAGIDRAGPRGLVRAQGLALVWARSVDAWLKDEDPGLAATLIVVDRELRRGERVLGAAHRVGAGLCRLGARLKPRHGTPPAEPAVAAGEGI